MSDNFLQYDQMVEAALRSVVSDALQQVAKNGLQGDHHFYIAFQTRFLGVELPESLMKQYPKEMTIVLQHQFYGLKVQEEFFSVSLSFNGKQERLVIPFAAVTSFADPGASFALQFQSFEEEAANSSDADENDPVATNQDEGQAEPEKKGEVISLDTFRKKKT